MPSVIDGSASATFQTPLPVAQGGTGSATAAAAAAAIAPLQLGSAQNTTSGTFVDFTGIPAGVKRITVMLRSVSTTGTSNPIIQIGAGSVDTSGYLTATWLANTNNANYTNGFNLRVGTLATVAQSGHIVLTLMGSNVWIASGVLGQTGGADMALVAGEKALSGAIDRIRLTTAGGTDTFDAGSVNIMWEF